jgi:hypothetical protein
VRPNVTKTSMLIRVQARGGKFLADDIGGAEVTVRDALTGERLGGGLVQGTDSGNLTAELAPNASQSAVVTPGGPGSQPLIQWLVPDATTSALTLELPLRRPTLLAVAAYGPLGGLQSAQRVESTTWALPGQSIDQGPGFVIELPGLVVQVLSPQTHLEITSLPTLITFQVKVMMMCGCQIAPGEPWIPEDFAVKAAIGAVGQAPTAVVPLEYEGNAPSLFAGSHQLTQGGFFQAVVSATQHSTGNLGTAMVTFYVESGSH